MSCNNNCNCTPPVSCDCPTFLKSDCVTFTEDLGCSLVNKDQTLTETIVALDAYICTAIADIDVKGNLISVGDGAEVYKGVNNAGKREIRSIKSDSLTVTENTNDITINLPYKIYTVILNQTGTNAPVANVLQNNTGATLTWARLDVGQYTLTASTTLFTATKTVINDSLNFITSYITGSEFTGSRETTTVCNFLSTDGISSADDIIQDTFLEIRIYPT